jgi:outer membrane protein OmpA-like peptidoglycan-associated protein
MKKTSLILALLAAAVFTTGCSSMPTHTSQLDQTRSDYLAAQRNPDIAKYAALEMQQAGVAMDQANSASADGGSDAKINKLAYLAQQKVALAQEIAKQKSAEESIASASHERDRIRLESRSNEANRATLAAEQSQLAAQAAQAKMADAQAKTADAQARMEEAQARTEQLETQLAGMSALKTERGMVITLGDVLFGTDLTRLTADGMRTVQKLADVLQKNPQRTVLIEGFTDSTGSAAHNQELSERRAGAVRSALVELGVPQDRVAIHGYGQSYPVAANDATHKQMNRRVEIIVSDASGKIAQR